jgi:RIO-like serine/threonine protein kinase
MSRVGEPRNVTKATVTFEQRGSRAVAVKDFSLAPWWFRALYARRSLAREARAYERLQGVAGIPECLGMEGPDRLILERAGGRPLDQIAHGAVPAAAFDHLERLIDAIHTRGVAIADLHRSNVLVDEHGNVALIDFALARVARNSHRPGRSIRWLQQLDKHAAARIRAHYLNLPEPVAPGLFGAVYRFGRRFKRLIRIGR